MQKACLDTLLRWNDLTLFLPQGVLVTGSRPPESPGIWAWGGFPLLLCTKNRDGPREGEACLCAPANVRVNACVRWGCFACVGKRCGEMGVV